MVYHLQHSGREQDIPLPRRPNSQPSPPSTKPQSTSLRITTRITTSCNPMIFSSLRTLQNGTFRNPNVFNSFCTLRKNPGGIPLKSETPAKPSTQALSADQIQADKAQLGRLGAPPWIAEVKHTQKCDAQDACDSLAHILDHMQTVANVCAESVEKAIGSDAIQTAAKELIAAAEKIRALAGEPPWGALSPVVHNLDWQLRMLPKLDPGATFHEHAHTPPLLASCETQTRARAKTQRKTTRFETELKTSKELLRKGEERGDRCLIR